MLTIDWDLAERVLFAEQSVHVIDDDLWADYLYYLGDRMLSADRDIGLYKEISNLDSAKNTILENMNLVKCTVTEVLSVPQEKHGMWQVRVIADAHGSKSETDIYCETESDASDVAPGYTFYS